MKQRTKLKQWFSCELSENKRLYILVSAIYILGLLLGSFACVFASVETDEDLYTYLRQFFSAYTLQGAENKKVVQLSFSNSLMVCIQLFLSGWYLWLLPLGLFQVGLKGYSLGFTVASFCKYLHFKGLFLSIFSILPQSLLFLPSLFFYMVYQFRFATKRRFLKQTLYAPRLKRQIYMENVLKTSLFLGIIFLSSLVDGYVVPIMIRPFCGLEF